MSSKAIVCAACGAAVPYGRLSCPACGELLASVAGAARTVVGDRPDEARRSGVAGDPAPCSWTSHPPLRRAMAWSRPSVLPRRPARRAPSQSPPASTADWRCPPPAGDARSRHGGLLDDAPPAPHVADTGPAFVQPGEAGGPRNARHAATLEPSSTDERPEWNDRAPEWPDAQTQWRRGPAPAIAAPVASVTSPAGQRARRVRAAAARDAGRPTRPGASLGRPPGRPRGCAIDAPSKPTSRPLLDRRD